MIVFQVILKIVIVLTTKSINHLSTFVSAMLVNQKYSFLGYTSGGAIPFGHCPRYMQVFTRFSSLMEFQGILATE